MTKFDNIRCAIYCLFCLFVTENSTPTRSPVSSSPCQIQNVPIFLWLFCTKLAPLGSKSKILILAFCLDSTSLPSVVRLALALAARRQIQNVPIFNFRCTKIFCKYIIPRFQKKFTLLKEIVFFFPRFKDNLIARKILRIYRRLGTTQNTFPSIRPKLCRIHSMRRKLTANKITLFLNARR